MSVPTRFTPIIGLEIHVELKTNSKMFCACSAHHFQVKPNTHTCPVCLGLPGALPVPNKKAVEWCQRIGLALSCQLAEESKFDRKNYFYPDLAKGYQISQYDQPLCFKGKVTLSTGKEIGITRVHMEEDTAKNVHRKVKGKDMTLVDFNRSGVPLVEIVTEPDFRSADEVDEFLKELRRVIRFLEVSDADMEKGSMRLEVNMSLLTDKDKGKFPSYKVEVKNINSFRFVKKAIEYEYKRQSEILNTGKTPRQETRGYQEDVDKTISQRSKEEAHDYRYFPEPDIPPMCFTEEDFRQIKEESPKLPQEIQDRFEKEYGLPKETAAFLTETPDLVTYTRKAFAISAKASIDPKDIANTIKNKKYDWTKLEPEELIEKLKAEKTDVITDEKQLSPIVDEIITQNPKVVKDYKAGKQQVIGFFIGQVMLRTKGKADAKAVQDLFRKKLS